jgi:hypothetical protein
MREEAEGRPPLLPISGSCSCSSDFTCTIKGQDVNDNLLFNADQDWCKYCRENPL